MAESLYLNGNIVDLKNKPITRVIQVASVQELGERKSSYSYTIDLPKTSRNINILDMLGVNWNTSNKPFEEVIADYYVDEIPIVKNGFAIIRESGNVFKINLIDGIRSLSNILSGKKLIDLPLSDLNHILTTANYTDSFSNTEGYIYCIANYGFGTLANLKVEQQAPSIFVHTLFRRIFESNGLSLIGDFFTTNTEYLNEVLTPAKGYLIEDVPLTSTSKGSADSNELTHSESSGSPISTSELFDFTDIDLVDISIVNGDLVFANAGLYKIDIATDYAIGDGHIAQVLELEGSGVSYNGIDEGTGTLNVSATINVAAGETVSLRINGTGKWDGTIERYFLTYAINSSISVSLQSGGQLIEVSDYIGDMNQLDFVKDIINRYGLILRPLRDSGEFEFKQLDNILSDIDSAEDWTNKIASKGSTNYNSGYAKINKAKYNYPESIVIPNNDGEMLIDNVNAAEEKTMFSSSFEIPAESTFLGGVVTYHIPIWELVDSVTENKETPLRVMKIERVDVAINAKLFTEVTGIDASVDIPFLSLENMSMQFFLDTYYPVFKNNIENYRGVAFKMNLSIIDIYNLDFFKLKYSRHSGRFYYLTSVQYTHGKASTVKLMELSEN